MEQTKDRLDIELPPTSDLGPAIWVGARDDYDTERRYGAWLDASADETEVASAVRTIIERTPHALGRIWRVCELRGFGNWQPDDTEGLAVVLRVAHGIATYGPPYAALAAKLGADSLALQAERYQLSYLGAWSSLDSFAETVMIDSGWNQQLDRLPRTMRPYVQLDRAKIAADISRDLTIIDHADGVWVYDPRVW